MRWLSLVCLKCKHVKFMSENPPVLSLCFKLGVDGFLPSFHLDFVENLRSSQLEKKNTVELPSTVWHHVSSVSHYKVEFQMLKSYPPHPSWLSSSPSPITIPSCWSSIVFTVEPQCQTHQIINLTLGKHLLANNSASIIFNSTEFLACFFTSCRPTSHF